MSRPLKKPLHKSSWKSRLSSGMQKAGKASFNMLESMGKSFDQSHPPHKHVSHGKKGKRTKKGQSYMEWLEKELSS